MRMKTTYTIAFWYLNKTAQKVFLFSAMDMTMPSMPACFRGQGIL